jgi:hypothetical protein
MFAEVVMGLSAYTIEHFTQAVIIEGRGFTFSGEQGSMPCN